jgi:choline dehydrogenase
VADLPGVGAGLADHPVTRLLLIPRPCNCDLQTPLTQVVLRYTAPGSAEFNDMQQVIFSHVDVAGVGGDQAVATVGTPFAIGLPVALERPRTRGRLQLVSTDPRVQPLIQLNFAAAPEDLRRLIAGVRLAWQIAHQPEIVRHTRRVALLSEETIGSDDAMASYVRATVATQFHPCGSAGWARLPIGWPRSTSIAGSAPCETCASSTRQSCRRSRARILTSAAS